MRIGGVYADGDDFRCKIGGLPGEDVAPYTLLKFADDDLINFNYSCDELRKRYFIYPQNLIPAQSHGMIADIRVIRLFESSYFTDSPVFTLSDYDVKRLLACAKK